MTPKTLIPTLLTTTLLLLTLRHVSSASLLHQTCKNASAADPNIPYPFCIAALQSAPAARCAALPRLGLLSLRLLKDNVTDTRCHVRLLIKDTTSAATKAALRDCLELYSDAVATMKEAVGSYKAGKYFEANVKISAVMDGVVTCEDGFRDVGVRSPLTRWNGFSFRLSAISLSIMSLLRSAI